MGKKRVLVTFPTPPSHPYLHKQVVFVSWRLLADKRHDLTPIIPTHNPFENNLHHCVNQFVEGDYDFWLTIDADNPPTKNPLDLTEYNLDVVGLPTPVVHFDREKLGERPVYYNAYKYIPEKDAYTEWPNKQGLQMVDAVGTGCVLFSKRVFQNKKMRQGAFVRKLNPDGTVEKGNDISFSERARQNGFEIYAHFNYLCRHYNEVDVAEMIEHWISFKEKNKWQQ